MNIRKTQMTYFFLIFLAGVTAVGCVKPHVYIHPSPGLDRIKKIAVMPFDNFTKDDKAGKKVRTNFVIEFLRTGSFNVMDIGEVDKVLHRAGLSYSANQNAAPIINSPRTEEETTAPVPLSKKIGDTLNVEAILIGSVEEYSTQRIVDRITPEVSISARLIDAETGIIIWTAAHMRQGSAGMPILGWGKVTSLSVLSQRVIEEMVNSLAEYAH